MHVSKLQVHASTVKLMLLDGEEDSARDQHVF